MRRPRSFFASERAASAIEFAVVAPVFLLLVLSTLEFGRFLWTREALQEAATLGARCMGILQSSCSSSSAFSSSKTTSYLQTLAAGWSVALPSGDVSLNDAATCGGVSGFSQVTISYTFQTIVPAVVKALSGGVPVSVSACFPNQA